MYPRVNSRHTIHVGRKPLVCCESATRRYFFTVTVVFLVREAFPLASVHCTLIV
jgi:hypothetical protein